MYFRIKTFFYLCLISIFGSCTFYYSDGIEVKIENDSNKALTNVVFTTTEKLDSVVFKNVKPNEKIGAFLSMKKNKSDGSYILKYTANESEEKIIINGYYTNGGALDVYVEYIIKNDTALVKFDFPKY